jgi:hypothetical protein
MDVESAFVKASHQSRWSALSSNFNRLALYASIAVSCLSAILAKGICALLWSLSGRRNDQRASNVWFGMSTISQHHLWPHRFGLSLHHPSAHRPDGRYDECVGNEVQEFRRVHMFS